jgi:hypothetical protein
MAMWEYGRSQCSVLFDEVAAVAPSMGPLRRAMERKSSTMQSDAAELVCAQMPAARQQLSCTAQLSRAGGTRRVTRQDL